MDAYISVAVLSLEQLLSGRYHFRLPWFQRAYAWREEQAGRLLRDMAEAMASERRRYCLGHLHLAKPTDAPDSALIDGQQRIITLTILFALLRDRLPDGEHKTRLEALLTAPERAARARGAPATYRLSLQPDLREFFERFVQAPGATRNEPDGDFMRFMESERNILANRGRLAAMLGEIAPTPKALVDLALFLMTDCCLIVEAMEDEEEAWDRLATEQETGLQVHASEIAKVSLINAMPRQEQEEAGHVWDRCQAMLGADDMRQLLDHVRASRLAKRSSKPVVEELIRRWDLNKNGLQFMQQEIRPRAELVSQMKSRTIGEGTARIEIGEALETLSWLDHQMWMPAALRWLSEKGASHPDTVSFFRRLDRLAWLLKLSGTDPTAQETRFIRLVGDIKSHRGTVDRMPHLQVDKRTVATALENLRSRTFYAKHYSDMVLRRLSRLMGADPGVVDGGTVTIEHVLPRKPPKERAWWQFYKSTQETGALVNRLGNLVLLSLAQNQAAGTGDYSLKREIMQGSGFVLAERAAQENATWTAETIHARTEALIGLLFTFWQIEV